MFVMQGKDIAPLYSGQVSLSSLATVGCGCVVIFVNPRRVYPDSTDWAADFSHSDSHDVSSCAAIRKTFLPVLAVPRRQRAAQTQSKSNHTYHLF